MSLLRSFACTLLVLIATASSRIVHAEVPLIDFARHARFNDIKISPQGDYLAASAVVDGKAVLSLIRLNDMTGVNVRPRGDNEIADFWWIGPYRLVYSESQKTSGLEQPVATGGLYAVNADGSEKKVLFSSRGERSVAELVLPLVVNGDRVLIAQHYWAPSVYGVLPKAMWMDFNTGRLTQVVKSPILNATFVADDRGDIRFAYALGVDQALRVYYRQKDASWELLFDESRKDPAVEPIRFNHDGSAVYFRCGGTHGVGGICLWDVATRKLSALWSGTVSGAQALMPTFDDKDVFAIRTMPGVAKTILLGGDSPEARLLAALTKQFPDDVVVFTSHTTDAKKIVFSVNSDRNPGQFYLYDATSHHATLLFARMPWIKPAQMATMQPISLKARDGLDLHGYLTRPPDKSGASGLPLVVFVHGGPYGIRDDWAFDPYVQMLASRGYAVLQVNYRGSGDYGYAFERAGYREWGAKMQDDITDATKWSIARGIADPKRICVFGGSYGGYAALEGAVKEPDLYRCAIGYVGIYDLHLMYKSGDIPQSKYGKSYLKMVLGEDEAQLWDRSPIAHLDRLKAKIMLIVGGADTRVPPVQGERLHAALDKAHIAHEWLYQRTEGHGFYDEKNVEDLYMKLIAFLDHNIGSGTAAH